MRISVLAAALSFGFAAQPWAQEMPLIPEKRATYLADADLPGGDLAQYFDTTMDACQLACTTNAACTAFTFNTANNSCFPKTGAPSAEAFAGAVSALILPNDPAVIAEAKARREELGFLGELDLGSALVQAETMGRVHYSDGFSTARDYFETAFAAANEGAPQDAAQYMGVAVTLSDAAEDWAEYARYLNDAANLGTAESQGYRDRAVSAAINAYLRAGDPALRHNVLLTMAQAFEPLGRGRDSVQALRLAQALDPRDDTAVMLDDMIGKYGFRISENQVQSDGPRPRICAVFSEPLADKGVDYETFVQLPEDGLTVTVDSVYNLCVEGVQHGARYSVTFREGLPAADGQVLAKDTVVSAYVRDRGPQVRFPARAYVLPKGDGAAIPVVTVNTTDLDLSLYRVTDRNLLRAFQGGYFSAPMADYQEFDFNGTIGAPIWKGAATVGGETNKDTTTRLPMAEALAGQSAGIYALKAAVPGADPYVTAPAWQWFVVSDLGITSMSGVDGVHVFIRSLGTADAKAGVAVDLLSQANEVLATATTDDQGYAMFDAAIARGTGANAPALLIAREGEADVAFLSLTDPEFDLSDRGVEGREAAPPVDVFLTTERGAYRAGEVIHATALARDSRADAVAGLPLTAILRRPDGVEYSRQLVEDGGAGGYVFTLPTEGNAPRGVWRLEVLADTEAAALATKTLLVEDFLPERIDFDVTLADGDLRLGDVAQVTVNANYLFGAKGADLAVEGEVLVREATEVAGFEGYAFGRHDEVVDARMEPFFGTRTDADGFALIDAALPQMDDIGKPLEARFTVRVAEGSGRPVERQELKPIAPSAPMLGIKPMFEDVAAENSEARFSLVGLGSDGQPAAMGAKWTLSRIETNYQWYQSYGNWSWEPVTSREVMAEGEVALGTAPSEIAAPVQWGEYELLVESDTGAAASTTFYAGWYAPADTGASPDTLELSLDAPNYKSGDTANLRVVPRAAGKALVTVLSNRLVAMKAVDLAEGENIIPLDVTDDWGAGVYVTVTALRGMDVAAGRNPARALGLTYAAIDPGKRQLAATVEVAAEVAPRGPLDVAVKVDGAAEGEQVYATIAAVDQGILNLTAFESPDPSAHYFGQRKLGVGIRDVYGRLIDGLNGAEGQVRSGGDAGAQARLKSPPPTEELVAYFSGQLTVGADGYARTSFDLPSFNGAVKVMAVVWSKTGVGQAQADVLVRDPVVVTASLPRFMAPGDASRVLLEIVHATGPSGRMGLDVTGEGVTLGTVPSGVDLADGAKAVVEIPLTAGDAGLAKLEVKLTTPDGKLLAKTLQLPVQTNDPEIARTSRLTLAKGETLQFGPDAFAGLAAGSARATLAIGPVAQFNVPRLMESLNSYPYGCTEQMTSQALPLLYLSDVSQAMGGADQATIALRVNQSIAEILANQSSTGAFGLWGASQGDMWLDAYVTDFLSRAKGAGYAVPETAFRSALDNLRNQVNYAPDFDGSVNGGGEALAYALMVLAREGAAAIGDLRYYADVKGDDFATALAQAQLGAALASYGDQPRADAMFRRAAARLDGLAADDTEQFLRADYGTNARDAAAIIAVAAESGTQAIDLNALGSRIAQDSDYLSTQEAAWSLLAAHASGAAAGDAGVTIDGAAPTGPLVRLIGADSAPVSVANGGDGDVQITLTTFGVPTEPEPAGGNGYAITRSYYTLEGEAVTLDQVTAGDRFVTVLDVTPFANGGGRLMVNDPLPAGFEIDNPNLLSSGSLSNLSWLDAVVDVATSEFRQDRFLTAVDRYDATPFRVAYMVRAVSPGTFHHPAASVEDMYRPNFRARSDAGQVTIAP